MHLPSPDQIPLVQFAEADVSEYDMGAKAQNAQWAEFLRNLVSASKAQPDPLLKDALKFHPRFHMDLPDEDQRLEYLEAHCIRLCNGDTERARKLALDVIWS